MFLSGPYSSKWEALSDDQAAAILAFAGGVGALGDQRADPGQYLEERRDGGPWATFSYWPGAADFWTRARLMAIERLENDRRLLTEKANRIADAAGADVQGCKNAIAAAEEALKAALAAESEQRAISRTLLKDAEKVEAQLAPLRRELEGSPPAPVAADELEAAKT